MTEELSIEQKHALLKKQVAEHDKKIDSMERMITKMEQSIKESTNQLKELNKFLDRFNTGKARVLGAASVIGFMVVVLPATLLTYVKLYQLLF